MSEIRPDALDLELDEKPLPARVRLPPDVQAWRLVRVPSRSGRRPEFNDRSEETHEQA